MDASDRRTYRNVNVPLSWDNRQAYLMSGKGRSLTSRVEKRLVEGLDRGVRPEVKRAPRNTPRVCLSFDKALYERLDELSKELEANFTDVVYTLASALAPDLPSPKAGQGYEASSLAAAA